MFFPRNLAWLLDWEKESTERVSSHEQSQVRWEMSGLRRNRNQGGSGDRGDLDSLGGVFRVSGYALLLKRRNDFSGKVSATTSQRLGYFDQPLVCSLTGNWG